MQVQDIGKLLGLQGVRVTEITHEITAESSVAIIQVEPISYEQNCPCCKRANTIRNGIDGSRRITHLAIADIKCQLEATRQRLKCKECGATYTYEYDFVSGKERYTKAYKKQIYKLSISATVQHSAEVMETPYSSAERFLRKRWHE